MVHRLLPWVAAGAVTAGVWAGMIAGAGLALADDASPSDGGANTSESSDSSETGSEANSPAPKRDLDSPIGAQRSVRPGGATTKPALGRARLDADDEDKPVRTRLGGSQRTRIGNDRSPGQPADSTENDRSTGQPANSTGASDLGDDATTVKTGQDGTAVEAGQDGAAVEAGQDVTTEAGQDVTTVEAGQDGTTEEAERVGADSGNDAAGQPAPDAATWRTAFRADGTAMEAQTGLRPDLQAVERDDVQIAETKQEPVVGETASVLLASPLVATEGETQQVQAVAFASAAPLIPAGAAASVPPLTRLLDLVGTVIFDLYAVATRLIGGSPILPPNSTVTVQSRTLRIDCGCAPGEGAEVPVDWYFPEVKEGQPPPDRLIYLQHGFLASGPWYSHTAAALAEQTNSIVVAPTITSNFLASDGCWLGAAPMHQAIGNLFDDDNPALAASLASTGYEGELPQRVVLIGHSLGGGAVSGAAGYMSKNPDTADELAGVVLLDGVGMDGRMAEALGDVPETIPIYQLAAPKYLWNMFGVGSTALLEARPDTFIGVTLVGGSHVDSMRGGNPLIQFAQQLVSGFSQPQNVAAAQILMVGWVNDMFAEEGAQPVGIYPVGDQQEIKIPTPAGTATAVVLPNTLTRPYLLNFLEPFISLGQGLFTFEPACAAEVPGGSCAGSLAA